MFPIGTRRSPSDPEGERHERMPSCDKGNARHLRAVGWLRACPRACVPSCSATRTAAARAACLATVRTGQPREHILEVGKGVMPIHADRLQQAHHHRSSLAGKLAANEKPIPAPQAPRVASGSQYGWCRSARHRPAGTWTTPPSGSGCSR